MIINQYSDFQVYFIKKVILHEVYMTLHLYKREHLFSYITIIYIT
jgi:hypothetical protein